MLVIIEENYKISVWCREIVEGLKAEARKKRASLTFTTDIGDIEKNCCESALFIVGAETEWLNLAVNRAKTSGKHPIILSNQSGSDPENGVSRITEDIFGSMGEIMSIFSAKGCGRAALYACNPDSASDSFKKEAFLHSGGSIDDVFVNNGSLEDCFSRFYERYKTAGYSGIVCSNDLAAISLLRHMRNRGESIGETDIISYSNTIIARCTSPAISTVSANFENFGQLAFMIADMIGKGKGVSGIRIFCSWEIIHRETSSPVKADRSAEPRRDTAEYESGSFYGDEELMEMMRIETLLSECDKTDLDIINAILSGRKTAEIESLCFLTETAVKYRIKKMKDICAVSTREALKIFLSSYISEDKKLSMEILK